MIIHARWRWTRAREIRPASSEVAAAAVLPTLRGVMLHAWGVWIKGHWYCPCMGVERDHAAMQTLLRQLHALAVVPLLSRACPCAQSPRPEFQQFRAARVSG